MNCISPYVNICSITNNLIVGYVVVWMVSVEDEPSLPRIVDCSGESGTQHRNANVVTQQYKKILISLTAGSHAEEEHHLDHLPPRRGESIGWMAIRP